MRVVAIGGREIGRPGTQREIVSIDREILKLSGARKPRVLFLPTASGDSESYARIFAEYYGAYLGCQVSTLMLFKDRPSVGEMREMVLNADVVYVGGGNTLRMLKMWRRVGLDSLLIRAGRAGTVLAGISAGAVCWFSSANSDSRKSIDPRADYIRVRGLGIYDFLVCPHYDREPDRQSSLKRMLRRSKETGIGIDNKAALEIVEDSYRVLRSESHADVRIMRWRGNEYATKIVHAERLRPLAELQKDILHL